MSHSGEREEAQYNFSCDLTGHWGDHGDGHCQYCIVVMVNLTHIMVMVLASLTQIEMFYSHANDAIISIIMMMIN